MVEDIKKDIQNKVEELGNLCLLNSDIHFKYNDKDLVNATLVFIHFFMDAIYAANQGLTLDQQLIIAEETGKNIRSLIKATTGKDMHELVKVKQ